MFNSKFVLFVVGVLILCLVLGLIVSGNVGEDSVSNMDSDDDDVVYIWMLDDDGVLKLIPTTDNYAEGSASAPG